MANYLRYWRLQNNVTSLYIFMISHYFAVSNISENVSSLGSDCDMELIASSSKTG